MSTRVLVAGGSGYLGQFIAQDLASRSGQFEVAVTYGTSKVAINSVQHAFKLDALGSNALEEVTAIVRNFQPDVVVNCIAQSDLGISEKRPQEAERLNVPSWLVDALSPDCFLIHISTDIVYSGSKSHCKEEDAEPVCNYGKTKLAGEQYVLSQHPNSIVLRSALIYGPAPFLGTPKSSFVQATLDAIRQRKPIGCFTDEYRTPVYVRDIVRLVAALITNRSDLQLSQRRVFNMGGPDRCNRCDMAKLVTSLLKDGDDLLDEKKASTINFGYQRPLDVSMDSSRLYALVPEVQFTPIQEAVAEILKQHSSSL